jgi:ribose transport system substrate-binding protein
MRRLLHHVLVYLLVSTLAAGGGCGSSARTVRYRIAVIPKGTTHDFWKSIHAGALKAAAELGDVEIIWDGPAREDERQEQRNIVERHTSDRVSAIILAPCDRRMLVEPIERAVQQGIPVVIMDSGLEVSPGLQANQKYLGYVATDNKEGGRRAAELLGHVLKDRPHARVMLLKYQAGSESTEQREAGFREKLNAFSNLELIIPNDEAGATVDSAQAAAERILLDDKNLDGIFTPNESSTTGMLKAIRHLERVGKIKLVGFDGSEFLIAALRAGELEGLVLQDPFDMGYRSVLRAVDALQGRPPTEPVLHTNLQVATRANLDEPGIRVLYQPPVPSKRD